MKRLFLLFGLLGCASATAPYDGPSCTLTSHLVSKDVALDVAFCYPVCPANADSAAVANHQTLTRAACAGGG